MYFIVAIATEYLFRTRAIVGHKEDERIIERAHRLDLLQHAADFDVQAMHHRRVNRHLGGLKLPLPLRKCIPRNGVPHFVGIDLAMQFLIGEIPARHGVSFERREVAIH